MSSPVCTISLIGCCEVQRLLATGASQMGRSRTTRQTPVRDCAVSFVLVHVAPFHIVHQHDPNTDHHHSTQTHTRTHTHSCLASTPTFDLTTHARYAVEKKNYKGSYIVKKTRAKKHPLAPRRPPSAFLTYSQQMRKKAKDENPTLTNTDISRLLGQMWAKASDEVKLPFRKRELEEREKYKVSGPWCDVVWCTVWAM